MNEPTVSKNSQCARPMLVLVKSIQNEIPKSTFVVYYKNYAQKDGDCFKNIDQLK